MFQLSSQLLGISFFIFFIATILFSASFKTRKNKDTKLSKIEKMAFILTIFGFLLQVSYFVLRWIASGYAPVSNMFEYMTFFGITIVLAFIIIYLVYKTSILGVFALPIAMIIIAYASVFPDNMQPLVPALQSYWLKIHVTTAALGEGVLAISFVAGVIFLIKTVNQQKTTKETVFLELVMYALLSTVGFAGVTLIFNTMNYETNYSWVSETDIETTITYTMPAIVGPPNGTLEESNNSYGALAKAPSWMNGVNAPRKLNSLLWALLSGLSLYIITRLVLRKRIGAFIQPKLKNVRDDILDEIGYRSVLIGFPIFTLGALIFAMIWAQEAWTRFWGWDPKEVWALITWLFYAAYLHLRLSKGWQGKKSAWLAVIGFIIIMLNLVVVNLVIAGLHSYA
ncbi:c-type cytochrome biogenesis protein CcsB [Cytobacillus sp. Hm23]